MSFFFRFFDLVFLPLKKKRPKVIHSQTQKPTASHGRHEPPRLHRRDGGPEFRERAVLLWSVEMNPKRKKRKGGEKVSFFPQYFFLGSRLSLFSLSLSGKLNKAFPADRSSPSRAPRPRSRPAEESTKTPAPSTGRPRPLPPFLGRPPFSARDRSTLSGGSRRPSRSRSRRRPRRAGAWRGGQEGRGKLLLISISILFFWRRRRREREREREKLIPPVLEYRLAAASLLPLSKETKKKTKES